MPEYRQRWENLAEYSPIGITLVSREGRWLSVNPALCQMLGYEPEELMAKTFQDITHIDDLETDLKLLREMLRGERSHYVMKKRYFRKDNSVIHVKLGVSGVYDDEQNLLYFISQIVDLTPEYDAFSIDSLTGIYTRRRLIEEELPRLLDPYHSPDKRTHHLSVIAIDVNSFKTINDTLGHNMGDLVLKEVAIRLKLGTRREDICGRVGGDEFLVLLPHTKEQEVPGIVARLKEYLNRPLLCGVGEASQNENRVIPVSCAVGWASMQAGWTQEDLLEAADESMYQCKRAG